MQEMVETIENDSVGKATGNVPETPAGGSEYNALLSETSPRILLEVLSPGGTRLVLLFVYLSFALAIVEDRMNRLTMSSHTECPVFVEITSNDTLSWNGYVKGLNDLFGTVSLDARFPNGTNSSANDEEEEQIKYDLTIWASKRKGPPHSASYAGWHEVLRERHDTAAIHSSENTLTIQGYEKMEIRSATLASWYQNQESPPSRSRVHSYRVEVNFCIPLDSSSDNCPSVSSGLRQALLNGGELSISYDDVSKLNSLGAKLARIALVVAWLAIAASWLPHAIHVLSSAATNVNHNTESSSSSVEAVALQNDADLVSRLMVLLLSLLFYIDPIDCGIQFTSHNVDIPPIVAFLSFASRRVGEAGLLAALLLAADGDGVAAERLRKKAEALKEDPSVEFEEEEEDQGHRTRLLQSLVRAARRFRHRDTDDIDQSLETSFAQPLLGEQQQRRSSTLLENEYVKNTRRHWWLGFPMIYLIFSFAALGLRFPSLFGIARASTLALNSWPTSALRMYVGFSLGLIFAALGWLVSLICLLYRTGNRLERAPYVLTRRHQLSYRFFVLQATLVAGVASANYAALLIKLVSKYHSSIVTALAQHSNGKQHALEELSSALEALVADDVRDFASAFFFLCYLGLLLYLNLPPPKTTVARVLAGEAKEIRAAQNLETAIQRFLPRSAYNILGRASAGLFAASDLNLNFVHGGFVLSEKADQKRRRTWKRSVRNLELAHPDLTLPSQLRSPPQVFVLETARWLVRVSAAVYFDCRVRTVNDSTDIMPITGGSSGEADPRILGLEPISELHIPETDTYAIVALHMHLPWLVIAFRGSASTKHWQSNIDIRQHRLALHEHQPACYEDIFGNDYDEEMMRHSHTSHQGPFSDDDEPYLEEDEQEAAEMSPREPASNSGRQQERGRAVVDGIMRCFALVIKLVERTMGFVLSTTEAAGRAAGAEHVPGLNKLILPCVHRGFWSAYSGVREDLHRAVLKACLDNGDRSRKIERILITGHSLGGALATLASADLSAHALPRLRSNIRLTVVTFGSPRVGNRVWAHTHEKLCPDAWRVVNDGDLVTALPRFFFEHSGVPVVVDGRTGKEGGHGFLVVNPSFVEQRLRLAARRKLSSHFLEAYVRGLYGAAGLKNPSSAELSLFAAQDMSANDHTSQNANPTVWRRLQTSCFSFCSSCPCCASATVGNSSDSNAEENITNGNSTGSRLGPASLVPPTSSGSRIHEQPLLISSTSP